MADAVLREKLDFKPKFSVVSIDACKIDYFYLIRKENFRSSQACNKLLRKKMN